MSVGWWVGRIIPFLLVTGAVSAQAPTESQAAHDVMRLKDIDHVFVRSIQVRGVSRFKPAEIRALTAPYENRDLGLEQLDALRIELSKLYASHGYINSGVVIPDQSVADGTLFMDAIEGRLTRVDLVGKPHLRKGYLIDRIQHRVGPTLSVPKLQETLQWLKTDPLIERIDARLLPGDVLGQAELELGIQEAPRMEVFVTADNLSSSSVGSYRERAGFTARDLTGFGETFSASGGYTQGAYDAQAGFTFPLTSLNTQARGYYTRSNSRIIEETFKSLDIQSITEIYGLTLAQPLYDHVANVVSFEAGLEGRRSETSLLGQPYSFSPGAVDGVSRETVASAGFDWLNRGPNHVLHLHAAYRVGVNALGATIFAPQNQIQRDLDPTGADGRFHEYIVQGIWLYRLNQLWSALGERGQLSVRSLAQISRDPLMSLEKTPIGGFYTVRGYSENLLVRDNGVSATIELQLPIPGYRPVPHPRNIVLAPFFDYGRSWDKVNTQPLSTVDTSKPRHITGAGLGLLWDPMRGLHAQIYWGRPTGNNFQGDDPRRSAHVNDLQARGLEYQVSYTYDF